jgi:two-component system, LuxR family, response regulator FixJ
MSSGGVPIYVVDDDRAVLDSMSFLLESIGVSSQQFSDPYAFLQTIDSLERGCILTDLRMPSMSGVELSAALRSRCIDWPIILMSAHLDLDSTADMLSHGFVDVIVKPFTASSLQVAIGRASLQLPTDPSKVQPPE